MVSKSELMEVIFIPELLMILQVASKGKISGIIFIRYFMFLTIVALFLMILKHF